MIPAKLDLPLLYIGVTYGPLRFYAKDGAGAAVDLTGWKAYAQARLGRETIDLEATITDAAAGEITLAQFTDEETSAKQPGRYLWDMLLERPTGERLGPYFSGKLPVKTVQTHPATS